MKTGLSSSRLKLKYTDFGLISTGVETERFFFTHIQISLRTECKEIHAKKRRHAIVLRQHST